MIKKISLVLIVSLLLLLVLGWFFKFGYYKNAYGSFYLKYSNSGESELCRCFGVKINNYCLGAIYDCGPIEP